MDQEYKKEEIKNLAIGIENLKVRNKISSALDCLNDPKRHPIVTDAIKTARNAGYPEIALKLANLAYELNPYNTFFLVELGVILNIRGENQEVTDIINEFFRRVNFDSLSAKDKDNIIVTKASAYKGIGKISEGIRILEELHSDRRNVVEQLAEVYYKNYEPEKTIDLLSGRENLSNKMALWLAKSYASMDQLRIAKETIEPYISDPNIKKYFEELNLIVGTAEKGEKIMQEKRQPFESARNKIFLVHGRNITVVNQINTFLTTELNLETTIMSLEPHGGRDLTEKFEEIANQCSYAIFFFTADDDLILKHENKNVKRVRQNVILEFGYFWGLLGRRKKVAILLENVPDIELPSDIYNLGWIPITSDLGETKYKLHKELSNAQII